MVICVVGASSGDEGKGKMVDSICSRADVCVRYQGGANAGHSVVNERGSFALHILPSGVFSPNVINVIGNGVALNVNALKKEIEELKEKGVDDFKLVISDRVQLVMSYHILFDKAEEERLGKNSFGSTKSGIAPFYADKAAKIGFAAFELFETEEYIRQKINNVIAQKNALLEHLYYKKPIFAEDVYKELMEYRDFLAPYLDDTRKLLRQLDAEEKLIVLEGQLGALRDPDFGMYPMVTSSSPLASYAPVGCGILPSSIKTVIAVNKAYSTSVGTGYMVPKMDTKEEEQKLRDNGGNGGEYGVTTGRPRDVAWFDCVASRYGCEVQGATMVALTCIDCLSYLDEIKVCIGYEIDGREFRDYPTPELLKRAEPIYMRFAGWKKDIRGITDYDKLPIACKTYINFLEQEMGAPIDIISTGPAREETIYRRSAVNLKP